MPHAIFPSDGDEVHSSDDIRSSELGAVQANNHDAVTAVPGTAAVELSSELVRPMQAPPPPQSFLVSTLSISALADHCMHEINLYHQGVFQGDTYCVELFRRATLQDDQDAWQAVQQCLGEKVRRWLDGHPRQEMLCRLDKEEYFVTQAFERFYQATVHQQIAFNTLADVLHSLRAYLNSALLDALRASTRSREIQVPKRYEAEQSGATSSEQSEVWEMISTLLPDVREQRLASLLFRCGLKPKDITRTYPQEFQDVGEISSLRCRLIQQLLDHMDQPDWSRDTAGK